MLIIGVDPGISGSICFFQDGAIKDVVEMPTMIEGKKNKKQVNGSQIFNEISEKIKNIDKKNIKVVIEPVTAMPGQGVTSMFNFGQSFGILKGICSAMQLSVYFCLLYTSDAADEEDSVDIQNERKDDVTEFLDSLEDDDDVQNVFSNVNLGVN